MNEIDNLKDLQDTKEVLVNVSKELSVWLMLQKYLPQDTNPVLIETMTKLVLRNEKHLKALEIIAKNFRPYDIENLDDGKVCVYLSNNRYIVLPKEEFNFLKEVVKKYVS